MKGLVIEIEKDALENKFFRRVIYTAPHCQLVIMSLEPGEDIGEETHTLDQFIRCEQGVGVAVLNGITHDIHAGTAVLVPSGTTHNITNTADHGDMKLYTVYTPPNHRDGVVHQTKADAEADSEHYDGKTTEPS